jgi:threonine aldolase
MKVKVYRGFASDNNAGIHPALLTAIQEVNSGHAIAYGDDPFTLQALKTFKEFFGNLSQTFFVLTGTGANVLGLSSLLLPFNAVICADTSHIHVDECGAPEKFSGSKLLTITTKDGKLKPEQVRSHLHGLGFEHHVQPKVISISQPTEMGTIYQPTEIKELAKLAREYNMYLHMDGARLANAAAALDLPFMAITRDVGVDILSFGGTKNGLLFGESVVVFQPNLAKDFKYRRKQGMQLASKMRYIGAQFDVYLRSGLWLSNAIHANSMANLLYKSVASLPGISITQKVETNAVFATIPKQIIKPLQKKYFFYVWNEDTNEVRWMTSFDTEPSDIAEFVTCLSSLLPHQAN